MKKSSVKYSIRNKIEEAKIRAEDKQNIKWEDVDFLLITAQST